MIQSQPRGKRRLIWACSLSLLAWHAWACSVPVFRYALERWTPDPYEAVVFHRGPLSAQDQAGLRDLGGEGLAGQLSVNLAVRTIDLEKEAGSEWTELWNRQKTDQLPRLVVLYPRRSGLPVDIWSGPLSAEAIKEVLDSPIRRELVQRLSSGQSAVWLLLEVGDKAKDETAAAMLQEQLQALEKKLELPKLETEDAALVADPQAAVRVAFSLLRFSRRDPNEQPLVRMLLGMEEDLANLAEPMAFPVFGRGRALFALVGKGIGKEMIEEACSFLVGPCSCQVKELNPGVDLLLAADWDNLVQRQVDLVQELPVLSGLADFSANPGTAPAAREAAAAPKPVAVTPAGPPAGVPPAAGQKPSGAKSVLGMVAWVGAFGLAMVGLATVLLMRRKG